MRRAGTVARAVAAGLTPRVHVVVVAYHGADDLARCLSALGDDVDVTVVDNSSSELVRIAVARHGALYVDPGRNLGFAGGVNVALRDPERAPSQDILLLNPDAVLRPGDLDRLVGCLHAPGNERVAAVSPRLIGPDGSDQRVEWPFPSPRLAWSEALGFGHLASQSTFVIGAVLMIRAEALTEVGLFDERFFLYAEEADWQRRAWELGWMSSVCPGVVARHQGSATSTDSRRRDALFHAGQETYVRKWHGRSGWLAYRVAACLGAAVRAVVLRGERRSRAARRAMLYLRGPRRCAFGHD